MYIWNLHLKSLFSNIIQLITEIISQTYAVFRKHHTRHKAEYTNYKTQCKLWGTLRSIGLIL